jgi:uncharacterized protein YhdP
MEKEDLKLIINAIESGKCLAFLGAGACTPFKNHKNEIIKGLPTSGQLAEYFNLEIPQLGIEKRSQGGNP